MQATILATMFVALESGKITAPLSPNHPATQNVAYIQDFLLNLLKTAFPHLNEYGMLLISLLILAVLFLFCFVCLSFNIFNNFWQLIFCCCTEAAQDDIFHDLSLFAVVLRPLCR